jgi:hypothetical protein
MMFSGTNDEIDYYNPDLELEQTRSVATVDYMGFLGVRGRLVYYSTNGYLYDNYITWGIDELLLALIIIIIVLCVVAIIVAIVCMKKRKNKQG